MSGHITITSAFDMPAFAHAWRDSDGDPHGNVDFGRAWVTFDTPAQARAAADACNQAAGAMEALPPAQDGGTT